MSTLTPTQDSTIYQLAAQMMADAASDADRARIDKALDLVETVERLRGLDIFIVRSASTPDGYYRVTHGQCNCPDAARRDARTCKHAAAVALFQQVERAEVDAEQAQRPRCPVCGRPADRGCIDEDGNRLCACDDHGDWEVPAIRVDPEQAHPRRGVPCAFCGFYRHEHHDLEETWEQHQAAVQRRTAAPPAIRVDPEDSILDLWPSGEYPDLLPLCPRCHAEPAIVTHCDRLGIRCLQDELCGEAV